MSPETAEVTVRALLDAASLTVSDDEFERFVAVYPTLRAQADGLYLEEFRDEDPAIGFDPAAPYA